MTVETTSPRIYVASLADYNAGRLHGVWINADQEAEDIWEAINAMLKASTEDVAEDWAIHDYEGFGPLKLSEYESIEKIAAIAQAMEESYNTEAFLAWCDYDRSHLDDADDAHDLISRWQEEYRGTFDDEEDFARNDVEELGIPSVGFLFPEGDRYSSEKPRWSEVLDKIDYYLDWSAIASAVIQDYYTVRGDSGLHFFRSL